MKVWLYDRYRAFLTWFGDIYFATEPPLCTALQIEYLLSTIQPGDVVCRGYNYYLDSHFIPGDYSHSGIVLNSREMVHAIAEGIQSIHPIDFVKDTDRFIILRPHYPWGPQESINCAVWHADVNNTQYDFLFNDSQKFYCHEFTADCLNAGGVQPKTTHKVFGVWPFRFSRDIFLAQNLIDVSDVLYEFNP